MDEKPISDKELEALGIMADISILLYSEICQNLGRDSEYLSSVYEYINGISQSAWKNAGLSD